MQGAVTENATGKKKRAKSEVVVLAATGVGSAVREEAMCRDRPGVPMC